MSILLMVEAKVDSGLIIGSSPRYDVRKEWKHKEDDGSQDARQVGWNEGQAVHRATVCKERRYTRLEDDADE